MMRLMMMKIQEVTLFKAYNKEYDRVCLVNFNL